MKKFSISVCSLIIAAVMVISLYPAFVFAAQASEAITDESETRLITDITDNPGSIEVLDLTDAGSIEAQIITTEESADPGSGDNTDYTGSLTDAVNISTSDNIISPSDNNASQTDSNNFQADQNGSTAGGSGKYADNADETSSDTGSINAGENASAYEDINASENAPADEDIQAGENASADIDTDEEINAEEDVSDESDLLHDLMLAAAEESILIYENETISDVTVSSIDISGKGVVVRWDPVESAEGYAVYRRLQSAADWIKLGETKDLVYGKSL